MKCTSCGGTDFEPLSGFFYCLLCGTQGFQQLEYEHNFGQVDSRQNKTILKSARSGAGNQLTSWEEYNYILLGLVNELIDLGAKEDLKLTTLQLWAAYLRFNEVAFFSRKEPKIPKLGASFKPIDAAILYNLKREKRARRKRARSGASSDGTPDVTEFSRRELRKQQGDLARVEYATQQSERDADGNSSILQQSQLTSDDGSSSVSVSSSVVSQQVRLEFSRISRRVLKKIIPKKHLKKHESHGLMNCHTFQRQNYRRGYTPEVVSRSMMYEILYLALNQIEDDIQIGDMIRYIRDGHLAFTDVTKFFPPNVRNQKHYHNFQQSVSVAPTHAYIRFGSENQQELLKVDMKTPDLVKLSKRYVDELVLPWEVHKMVHTLLTVCPPEMSVQPSATFKMPNYEGRVVALILFVVKLLFGLDDKREHEMSDSAERINVKIQELQSGQKRLFVWNDWVKYIEMRNVILSQCHYPIAKQIDSDDKGNIRHYWEFLCNQDIRMEKDLNDKSKMNTRMTNFESIFQKATQIHEEEEPDEPFIKFEPSLTPKRSYLDQLLSNTCQAHDIFIPKFMHDDHSLLEIEAYVNPSKLRQELNKKKIALNVKRVSSCDQLDFHRVFKGIFPDASLPYSTGVKLFSYKHDISTEDWKAENELKQQGKNNHLYFEQDVQTQFIRNHLAHNQEIHHKEKRKKIAQQKATKKSADQQSTRMEESSSDNDDGNVSQASSILALIRNQFEPDFRIEESLPIFNCIDVEDNDDEHRDYDESLDFLLNNSEYWITMGYMNDMGKANFENLSKSLPLSFQWMLKQCAHTIQCTEQDVYRELQIIENQYAYVLQSLGTMKNGLLYKAASNRSHIKGQLELSNNLQRYW